MAIWKNEYSTLWLNCVYNFTSFLQAFTLFAYILEEEEKEKRAAEWWKLVQSLT